MAGLTTRGCFPTLNTVLHTRGSGGDFCETAGVPRNRYGGGGGGCGDYAGKVGEVPRVEGGDTTRPVFDGAAQTQDVVDPRRESKEPSVMA